MSFACNGAQEKGLEPAHTHTRYIPTRRLGTLMANTDDSGVMLRERIKETHIKCGSGKATLRKSCRSAEVWKLASGGKCVPGGREDYRGKLSALKGASVVGDK